MGVDTINKLKKFFPIFFGLGVFILGCYTSSSMDRMIDVDNFKIEDVSRYSNSYLGDSSRVRQILSLLPGNSTIKGIEISKNQLTVHYGIREGSDVNIEQANNYWLTENRMEKIFTNNSAALFILIRNIEKIAFDYENSEHLISFSISKKDYEKFLNKKMIDYRNNFNLWEKEITKELVNDEKKRAEFLRINQLNNHLR